MKATHQELGSGCRLVLLEKTDQGHTGVFEILEPSISGSRLVCSMDCVIPYLDRSGVTSDAKE